MTPSVAVFIKYCFTSAGVYLGNFSSTRAAAPATIALAEAVPVVVLYNNYYNKYN